MPQFQYKVELITSHEPVANNKRIPPKIEDMLNRYGAAGWRLVTLNEVHKPATGSMEFREFILTFEAEVTPAAE
jgi:hypothetical protein